MDFENQPSRYNSMAETRGLGKPGTLRHMKMMSERAPNPAETDESSPPKPAPQAPPTEEIGGPKGPEPTRYGDWEIGGRCTDF